MQLAIQAKVEVAMLAPARVVVWLNRSYRPACWQWTPAHIVHGFDCRLDAELLVFLHHAFVKTNVFDI